jgi:hypothetical protein
VAELLGLALSGTYTLVRGGIAAQKLGGRWVVPKRRFHAWLDGLDRDDGESDDRDPATAIPMPRRPERSH